MNNTNQKSTPTTPFTAGDAIIGGLFHNEIILLSH